MKTARYECDKPGCKAVSNGDTSGWYMLVRSVSGVEVSRLDDQKGEFQHACGEACCLSLVAEAMRGLPK